MSRAATSRLKTNPPLGSMPVLQYCTPDQLKIDETYQRTLEAGASQTLIRKIAMYWNWDLCQPLVVARRVDGGLFVVDGQHRLAAAIMRRDIAQLPCVVSTYSTAADEAASFVALNQMRRPLSALDLFKAALAADDEEATAILRALDAAGLTIAPHSNHTVWKPGMVANIGGLQHCYRRRGSAVLATALTVLARAFPGEVLRYAGTIFPGIAHLVANEHQGCTADEISMSERQFLPGIIDLVAADSQAGWAQVIIKRAPDCSGGRREATEKVFSEAWAEFLDAYFEEDETA